MGFVFNLEKWIYENIKYIENYLLSNNSYLGSPNIIKNLKIRKSRINAQRIWKVFVLEKYLNDIIKICEIVLKYVPVSQPAPPNFILNPPTPIQCCNLFVESLL